MTRTWLEHLASTDRRWHVGIRIEGVGPSTATTSLDATGRYVFCVEPPSYSTNSPLWLPVLMGLPNSLSERSDPLGGWPQAGSMTFSLLDHEDTLTDVLGSTQRPPLTQLAADLASDATELYVRTGGGAELSYHQVLWVDGEALRVVGVTGDLINVTRGWLGTEPTAHDTGAPIYARCNYLIGRRVTLYLGPQDGGLPDERAVGQYVIESVDWDSTLNAWEITAGSQLRYLDRLIAGYPPRRLVNWSSASELWLRTEPRAWPGTSLPPSWPIRPLWDGEGCARNLDTDEVMRVRSDGLILRRGLAGTQPEENEAGQSVVQVFCADADEFRFSSPAATDRDTPTDWTPSAHFVDLLLCVLTSGAHETDGLELTNYDAAVNINWSCLPPGFGLGIPAALIDFESFLAVKSRTSGWHFHWFILGGGESKAQDALGELLAVTGSYLSTVDGKIKLVLPRMPLAGESGVAVDEDSVLRDDSGLPLDGSARIATENLAGSVRYLVGPKAIPLTYASADFVATYGQRFAYSTDGRARQISAPSVDPNRGEWLERLAGNRLFRWRAPRLEVTRTVDLGLWEGTAPGEIVAVTAEELPNLVGGRGLADSPFLIEEREIRLADGGVKLRLSGWGGGVRAARVSPSGYISDDDPDAGPPATCTLTITGGRYESGDNAALFTVGDKVSIIELDGSVHTSGLTVLSVGANTVVVDDDLAGGVTGRVLVWDDYASLTDRQKQRYAAYADDDGEVDGTGVRAFLHGEV